MAVKKPKVCSWSRWAVVLVLGAALASPRDVSAGNGDLLAVSDVLLGKTLADIVFDARNPSFWVVSELTGKIHHLSLDLTTSLGDITNPHGTGQFPNFILSVGIAFRTQTGTLFVLAQDQGNWRVKEVTTAGVEVPDGAFTVSPPDPETAGLRGLTFDTLNRVFWTLDTNNDRLLRIDLTGATTAVPLPGDEPPETVLRGDGLCFELEDTTGDPRVLVAHGDIFKMNPSRLLQLTLDGSVTGIEVPLDKVSFPDIRGFQTFRIGNQRRVAVVTGGGKIVQIEQVVPKPAPPSLLKCAVTLTNKVDLTWDNNGSGAGSRYLGEIIVLRNGVPFTTIPGDATSYIDATPLQGTSRYSLQASDTPGGPFSPPGSECQVTVGTGGIVRWIPFPGSSLYDLARDPATGEVFGTDNIGLNGQGRVLRFDSSLATLGEIPTPWPRPGPIAFLPRITIQAVTLQNVLAVGRTDGVLVKLIDLSGAEKTTISLETGAAEPRIGSLAYIPGTEEFAFTELSRKVIVVTDRAGRKQRECKPPDVLALPPYAAGITYDPIQNTFLTVFEPEATGDDVLVRELQVAGLCVPTGFSISLKSCGEGFTSPGFFGGIEIAGNTLLVAVQSRAICQVLIFPFGPSYKRGDFNRDEAVNLTDAVGSASYLFQSGPAPLCADAADANDDGVLDVSDPVYLLFHLFLQGPPPLPPFPDAGTDPTFRDNIGCEE